MHTFRTYRHRLFQVLTLVLLSATVGAQDLHFSQYFNSPLTTNPANTGFIPDGDYRLGINYRNQWSSVMSVPYKTMSAYGDVQILRDRLANGWMGVGGVVLRDAAGAGNLTSTKVYGSIAYHQMLGFSSLLSLGFNVGWANKSINTTSLKFPDQFDGRFFDSKLPTSAVLDRNSTNYLDMQVGMNYAYFPTEEIYINTGFSVHHLNKPTESFFTGESVDNTVPRRYIAFLNGSFKLNDMVILNPNMYYTRQASVQQLVGGLTANYNLSGDGSYQLIGGAYYRHREAVIPMVGLGVNDYTFLFSYDATMSGLRNYNGSRGAFEFSLVKQGSLNPGGAKVTPCPSFKTY